MYTILDNEIKDIKKKTITISDHKDVHMHESIDFAIRPISRGIAIGFALERNFDLVLNGSQILLLTKGTPLIKGEKKLELLCDDEEYIFANIS